MSMGPALDRIDGPLKVTGGARYSADVALDGVACGYLVQSTIARGSITAIDAAEAEAAPGVLRVLTHENAMRLPGGDRAAYDPPAGRVLTVLQEARVHYDGQPVALVVADTFEHARDAAALVRIAYEAESAVLEMDAVIDQAYEPDPSLALGQQPDSRRGDVEAGLAAADVCIEATYTTPVETHNPMEPHATIAVWDEGGESLTLYDATQGVWPHRRTVARALGIDPERVRVVSRFIGGGFGCKGSVWSHVILAAMAARQLERPVKVVLPRRLMFAPVGHRPETRQVVALGARRDGRLTAIRHASTSHTSRIEDWLETCALVTRMLYECDAVATSHRIVPLDVGTPTFTRAPGQATGTFALESAMDELAWALGMDPVALRLANYAERDPATGKPFSSKSLRACYEVGGRRFGWAGRPKRPRSMRDGDALVGWGMATATYPTHRRAASADATLLADGTAVVRAGTQDIGTGTHTIMAQIAAEALGLPIERVTFELGDTELPETPISGGSMTAASTGSAVHQACLDARRAAARLALGDERSPLHGAGEDALRFEDGRVAMAGEPARSESYAAIAERNGGEVRGSAHAEPPEDDPYAKHAFGAVFVEARVDAQLGEVRVPRVVGAYGVGRVLNEKTARSQLIGGIVWGLGMALMEKTLIEPRSGRIVNADLAEYHVPVNADVGSIDITFVDEDDPHVNPIGVKGIGEIGITGVAAAVANAVYHATGVRVRELPITGEKAVGP